MRIDGTLARWNDDRGFGFIAPRHGGPEVFVHISAFPRDGPRPRVGEPLSFEIEMAEDGRKRAKAVSRPGRPTARPDRRAEPEHPREGRGLFARVLPLLLVVGLGTYGYREYSRYVSHARQVDPVEQADQAGSGAAAESRPSAAVPPGPFRCDGRTRCPQMTSCAEATFFLRNCPGVQMDGDNDGIPCEDQWCYRGNPG